MAASEEPVIRCEALSQSYLSGGRELTELVIEELDLRIPVAADAPASVAFSVGQVGSFPVRCLRREGPAGGSPCGELVVTEPGQAAAEHPH